MYIQAIFGGVLCFLFVLVLQMVLAKVFKPPVSEDTFILFLFVLFPLVMFICLWCLDFCGLVSPETALLTYLLFFSIAASWVATYPAIYAACPTLIISYIARKRSRGTSLNDFCRFIGLKKNSTDRIADALNDNLIRRTDKGIELTGFGTTISRLFICYRRIIGLPLDTV